MARPGPRSEEKEDSRAPGARDPVALARVEPKQRPSARFDALRPGTDLDRPVHHEQPGVLVDLVVAELLAGVEADEDGSRLLPRVEHDRAPAAFRSLELEEVPALHRGDPNRPPDRGTPAVRLAGCRLRSISTRSDRARRTATSSAPKAQQHRRSSSTPASRWSIFRATPPVTSRTRRTVCSSPATSCSRGVWGAPTCPAPTGTRWSNPSACSLTASRRRPSSIRATVRRRRSPRSEPATRSSPSCARPDVSGATLRVRSRRGQCFEHGPGRPCARRVGRLRWRPAPPAGGRSRPEASGLKFEAPRGTHDILPSEQPLWQRAIGEAERLCALYGYRRIETPGIEDTELFIRTSGQGSDVVQKEMYTFQDRGGRSLTLRPEATAPICRAHVQHGLHREPQPQKLYTITSIYR